MLTNEPGSFQLPAVPGVTQPGGNPYDTNIPGAFGANGYADQSLAANTAYKNTLARINQKRLATLRGAGYVGDIDPSSGVLSNLRVDGTNAYGGLQQMLRSQAGDFRTAQDDAEARGLHGGLAHKADSELKYQHGGQAMTFGQGLTDALGGFQDEQNQAAYSRDGSLAQAEQAAAEAAIQGQQFNPGDYSTLQYPGYGTDPGANPPPTVVTPKALQVAQKVAAQRKAAADKVVAKIITANKTGATASKSRGVISIH
jgi:hypothetical protein